MTNKQKIIFMGTPDYATQIFEKLLENDYEIIALFTQPDKPVGRKQELTPPHIKQFALDNGLSLPIYQPNSLKEKAIIDIINNLNPDIIIVAAYGQILPKEVLCIAPCINLHASLLPKYRGASPIQESILKEDKFSGVTSMMMDVGLDSGDILGFKYVKIEPHMVVSELFDMLSIAAAELTIETLKRFDSIKTKQQNLSMVSHCSKIKKNDGLVDFKDANIFYNKYKAYKTWPDIYLNSGLKIKQCILYEIDSVNKEGIILEINKHDIVVGCSKGSIKIIDIQPKSKKQMNIVDYIRGKRLLCGDYLS
ncbi:MAG: methionyl-tRNA formyltransferase [Campylobacterota bacterium]|nr:methionyl-tRNA formyltransferase [Campylobacterota bacterium]